MQALDKMLRRMNSWLIANSPTIVTKSQQPTITQLTKLSLSPSKHRPATMSGGRL
jgi:hypothetical protein